MTQDKDFISVKILGGRKIKELKLFEDKKLVFIQLQSRKKNKKNSYE